MIDRRLALVVAVAALSGCSLFREVGLAQNEGDPTAVSRGGAADEPSHVVVQHVLVSFDGAKVPGVTRTREEAQRLAQRILEEARAGRDFAELIRLYTDDRAGDGTYTMANWGVPPQGDEVERRKMVRGFGNLAFNLLPGQVGVIEYDANSSPFGWHVMKRLR